MASEVGTGPGVPAADSTGGDVPRMRRTRVTGLCGIGVAAVGALAGWTYVEAGLPKLHPEAYAHHGGAFVGDLIVLTLGAAAGGVAGLVTGLLVGVVAVLGSSPGVVRRGVASLAGGAGGSVGGALVGWWLGIVPAVLASAVVDATETTLVRWAALGGSWVLGALTVACIGRALRRPGARRAGFAAGVVAGAIAYNAAWWIPFPDTPWVHKLAEYGLLHAGAAMPVSLLAALVAFERDAASRLDRPPDEPSAPGAAG